MLPQQPLRHAFNAVQQRVGLPPGYVPQQSEVNRQYSLAQSLAQQQASAPPVTNVLQGLNHVAQSVVGGLAERRASEGEQRRAEQTAEQMAGVIDWAAFGVDPNVGRQLLTLNPELGNALFGMQLEQNASVAGTPEPIEINGQLVDPVTYEVLGDYRDPQDTGGSPDYGFTNVPGVGLVNTNSQTGQAEIVIPATPGSESNYKVETIVDEAGIPQLVAVDLNNPSEPPVPIGPAVEGNPMVDLDINQNEEPPPTQEQKLSDALFETEQEVFSDYLEQESMAGQMVNDLEALALLSEVAPSGPIEGRLYTLIGEGYNNAADAMSSIITRIAPLFRVEGSGSTSDIEYEGMLNALPSLKNTVEGRRAILSVLQARFELNMSRAALVREFQNSQNTENPMSVGDLRDQMADLNTRSILTNEYRALVGAPLVEEDIDDIDAEPLPPGEYRWNPETQELEPIR